MLAIVPRSMTIHTAFQRCTPYLVVLSSLMLQRLNFMSHSISRLIPGLKKSDEVATQQLWDHFSEKLVGLARRKLGDIPKRVADEEDIASTVFFSLCRGAAAGRLADVKSRDELWWLLLAITKRKVADFVRHEMAQKRGPGQVEYLGTATSSQHGLPLGLDDLMGDEPTPELLAMLQEQHLYLLSLLRDDSLRNIANLRIEGHSTIEIASLINISKRSVERKLQLIRQTWSGEMSDD